MNVLLCGLGGMGRVHYANSVLIPDIHICAAVGSGEKDRAEAESTHVRPAEVLAVSQQVPVSSRWPRHAVPAAERAM